MHVFRLNIWLRSLRTVNVCFCFKSCKKTTNTSQISHQCHNKRSKCSPTGFTRAHRWFLKFAIDLHVASCGKSFQIFITAGFGSRMSFGYGFRWENFSGIDSQYTKVKWTDVWWAIWLFVVFANKILTNNKYTKACSIRNNVLSNHKAYHFCRQ